MVFVSLGSCCAAWVTCGPPCVPGPATSILQFGLIRRTTMGVLTSTARQPDILGAIRTHAPEVIAERVCVCGGAYTPARVRLPPSCVVLPPSCVVWSCAVVADTWSPHEIALFESAICLYGKMFSQIQKVVRLSLKLGCYCCCVVWCGVCVCVCVCVHGAATSGGCAVP